MTELVYRRSRKALAKDYLTTGPLIALSIVVCLAAALGAFGTAGPLSTAFRILMALLVSQGVISVLISIRRNVVVVKPQMIRWRQVREQESGFLPRDEVCGVTVRTEDGISWLCVAAIDPADSVRLAIELRTDEAETEQEIRSALDL